jgi:hypothetical protein
VIWWTPESPRWLIRQDRGEEALKMLRHYHIPAGGPDAIYYEEFIQLEYAEISVAMDADKVSNSDALRE